MNLVAHQLTARKNEKTMEGIEPVKTILLKEVELLQIIDNVMYGDLIEH
jgi:hypothetical protein